MTTCPDRGQLELLLANRLTDTERDELERHVEDCALCQQTLEALTNSTVWNLEPRQTASIAVESIERGVVADPRRVIEIGRAHV